MRLKTVKSMGRKQWVWRDCGVGNGKVSDGRVYTGWLIGKVLNMDSSDSHTIWMYLLLHGVKMVMMVNFLFCVFYNENIWFDNDLETFSFLFFFLSLGSSLVFVLPAVETSSVEWVAPFTVLEEGKSEAAVPADKGSGEVLTPGSEVAPMWPITWC